jgi:hypothetical protein
MIHDTLAAINRTWRENRPAEMKQYLHPDVTMVFPGFGGSIRGREPFVEGFLDFCINARVLEYEETDEQIQVTGHVGVASYRFTMLYQRSSYHARATGRDVWIFEASDDSWVAVWRTMLDMNEERWQ